jgi:hypothetical protein
MTDDTPGVTDDTPGMTDDTPGVTDVGVLPCYQEWRPCCDELGDIATSTTYSKHRANRQVQESRTASQQPLSTTELTKSLAVPAMVMGIVQQHMALDACHFGCFAWLHSELTTPGWH